MNVLTSSQPPPWNVSILGSLVMVLELLSLARAFGEMMEARMNKEWAAEPKTKL